MKVESLLSACLDSLSFILKEVSLQTAAPPSSPDPDRPAACSQAAQCAFVFSFLPEQTRWFRRPDSDQQSKAHVRHRHGTAP